jgi:hypothetical protein
MPRVMRRTLNSGFVKPYSRTTRIRVGENPARPFRLRTRTVIRPGVLHPSPWWWISHRRGLEGMPKIGEDPLERRAISKDLIRGTLPERIVYLWLIQHYFTPDVDFDFQSSLEGGRLELGGIVVDYMFKFLKIALQVQGPTHNQYLRIRKDNEQRMVLEQDGYEVVNLDMEVIYDEPRFEEEMRRIFNLGVYHWSTQVAGGYADSFGIEDQQDLLARILSLTTQIYNQIIQIEGYSV